MPFGPGKYDDITTYVRERCKAEGVIVIVHKGHLGNGFSVQAPAYLSLRLPLILRFVADEIERSTPPMSGRLSEEDAVSFRGGVCPAPCGGHLTEGPHGGDAVNYRCDNCGQLYCDLGPFGVERVMER